MAIELYKTYKNVRPDMGTILGTCGGRSAHEIRLENEIKRRKIHSKKMHLLEQDTHPAQTSRPRGVRS